MKSAYGLATVLALGLGASTMLAAERATFVLTDGERVSGEVVFHTEERTNIRADKNEFNLKVADGTERPIPFSHVVLIDFLGGQPRDEELAALPNSGHLMTMRNGESKVGRLVDMVGGTTVRFEEGGQRVEVPITSVRRIYLQPDRIRETYDVAGAVSRVRPQTAASTPAGRSNQPTTNNRGGRFGGRGTANADITVRGADAWTETNITVKRGQQVSFQATGEVFITRTSPAASPAGVEDQNPDLPVRDARTGSLIGKIGPNGTPFLIGTNTGAITMNGTGRLMLGINDTNFPDNSGAFTVQIFR
jgi:hypothetical protein